MPNRIIREGINDSLRINKLSVMTELFYRKLQLLVDDYGRYEAEPELLRHRLFGLRPEVTAAHIGEHLRALADGPKPLIVLYEVNDKKYLEIQDFGQRTRTEKYPSPALASICAHSHARASNTNTNTHTNSDTNTPTAAEESTESKPVASILPFRVAAQPKGPPGDDSFIQLLDIAGKGALEYWPELLEGPIGLEAYWWTLSAEDRISAIRGIQARIDAKQYGPNAYDVSKIPGLDSYIRKAKWKSLIRENKPAQSESARKSALFMEAR